MKKDNVEHEIFDKSNEPESGLSVVQPEENVSLQKISADDIDLLDDAEESSIELSSEYWSPKLPGEQRRVIFQRISVSLVPDINDKDTLVPLKCAYFLVKEGVNTKQICNGSKRLVGTLESFNLPEGTALQITFEGKVKNKNNGFSSDSWSIVPLKFKKK